MLRLLTLALLLGLASCSSIPMATLGRLSQLDERDLLNLDPGALRVRVSLPIAYPLDTKNSELSLRVVSAGRPLDGTFHLEIENSRTRPVSDGMLSPSQPATEYDLRLTEESRRALRELQKSVRPSSTSDVALDVRVALKSAPEGATSTKVWVDVLLRKEQGYVPLIDGGKLPVDGSDVHSSNHA
jgi:hypothetical protein